MHPETTELAALALGEPVDVATAAHVEDCAACRREVASLRAAADAARSVPDVPLERPPAGTWEAVRAATTGTPVAARPRAERRVGTRVLAGTTAAALVLGVVLGAVGSRLLDRDPARTRPGPSAGASPAPTPDVQAAADLRPVGTSTASGRAQVVETRRGMVLVVRLRGLPESAALREVWLVHRDGGVVSLGVLDAQGVGRFTMPERLLEAGYDTVDVSDEDLDGDPAHSRRSLARGQLRAG